MELNSLLRRLLLIKLGIREIEKKLRKESFFSLLFEGYILMSVVFREPKKSLLKNYLRNLFSNSSGNFQVHGNFFQT